MKFQRLLFTGTTLCFAAALAGCGNGGDTNTATDSNTAAPKPATGNTSATTGNTASTTTSAGSGAALTGSGATFPALLYTRWFDEYKTAKGTQIDYQAVGSGAGIKALTAQTVDFGASDAPPKPDETAKMPGPIVVIPTVGGPVALAYNVPGAPKDLKMSGDTLADVFLGKVTKWNDPKIAAANPGATLPATPITIAHRSDGSGTSYIFTNFLAAVSPEWKTKVGAGKSVTWPVQGLAGKGSDAVTTTISSTPGCIGYIELAYATKAKLSTLAVKNKDGQFVGPSVDGAAAAAEGSSDALLKSPTALIVNAAGAKSYPVSGFTYVLAYQNAKNPTKGAALKEFLKWAMTDGQKDATALNYAPLPKAVADANLKVIDGLK